jgi:hypothetical protein
MMLKMKMSSVLQNAYWNIQIASLLFIKEVKYKVLLWIERADLDLYLCRLVKSLYTNVTCFSLCICQQGNQHVRELDEEAPLLLGFRLIPDSENFMLEETVDTVLFHFLQNWAFWNSF